MDKQVAVENGHAGDRLAGNRSSFELRQSSTQRPATPPIDNATPGALQRGTVGAHSAADAIRDGSSFESFLAHLSATFVNVGANEVDGQIESALRQIVECLGIDRSGFGEKPRNENRLVITHSYEAAGIPPSPRIVLEEQMPWYARAVARGETLRLNPIPECLPPEADKERAYCIQVGLKSQLTIPLIVHNEVVGGIGFASFRSYQDWPDELVQRLRLVGEIFTNAIARKRADEALQAAHAQADALRNQLAHAGRLELVNHLTMSIAHELNQPLGAIASQAQTALELLQLGDLAEAKAALVDIGNDARRGSEVVGRIRQLVKKEAPARTPTCLVGLIDELRSILKRNADAHGVQLIFDLAEFPLSVEGDRVQLQQVVLNVLLNAVQATQTGSCGSPRVRIQAKPMPTGWVHVAVIDNGNSLDAADCERIFAPFVTSKPAGLGLGLSISRSIIEAHGGKLWAEKGGADETIVQFALPARREVEDVG